MLDDVQLATLADVGDIQTLERVSSKRFDEIGMQAIAKAEPTDAGLLEERIAAGQIFVFRDPQLIGVISFCQLEESAYIEQIDVNPASQGRRIGARLIDAVGSWAQTRQLSSLLLSTFREVPWNAPYYRRLGFSDLEKASLPPFLLALRTEHIARGLDETQRVFMSRPQDAGSSLNRFPELDSP